MMQIHLYDVCAFVTIVCVLLFSAWNFHSASIVSDINTYIYLYIICIIYPVCIFMNKILSVHANVSVNRVNLLCRDTCSHTLVFNNHRYYCIKMSGALRTVGSTLPCPGCHD